MLLSHYLAALAAVASSRLSLVQALPQSASSKSASSVVTTNGNTSTVNFPFTALDGTVRPIFNNIDKKIRVGFLIEKPSLEPAHKDGLLLFDHESKVGTGRCSNVDFGGGPLGVTQPCKPPTFQYTLLNRTMQPGKEYSVTIRLDHTVHYNDKQRGPWNLNGTVTKSSQFTFDCGDDEKCPKLDFSKGQQFYAQQAPAGWVGDAIK